MFRKLPFQKRRLALVLAVGLGMGFVFVGKATPAAFWRIVEQGVNFVFQYGSESSPSTPFTITDLGQVGLGTTPSNSSVLFQLEGDDLGLLLPRVASVGVVTSPVKGMMVYDTTESCVRVFQANHYEATGSSWSPCLDTVDGVRVETTEPVGVEGSVYFNSSEGVFYIHDGTDWLEIVADSVTVADGAPSTVGAEVGDLYFDRTGEQFFIFDGASYVNPISNITGLTTSQSNCRMASASSGVDEVSCGAGEFMASIVLESLAWTDQDDAFDPSEVASIECCQAVLSEYWWHTTDWGDCSEGNQSRTVTCRDQTGATATGQCDDAYRPDDSQNCEVGGADPEDEVVDSGPDIVARSCYADTIYQSSGVGSGNDPAEVILGAPQGTRSGTTDFDNNGIVPGSVIVELASRAQDGPGNDLKIWLYDNSKHGRSDNYEGFYLFVSDGGTSYNQVGPPYQSTSGGFTGAVEFDLADANLSGATHIKIQNAVNYASDVNEGPDIDAIEGLYCESAGGGTAPPTPTSDPEGISCRYPDGTAFDGTWTYRDYGTANDLAITCRDGVLTGVCSGHHEAPVGYQEGPNPGVYGCERSGKTVACVNSTSDRLDGPLSGDGTWNYWDLLWAGEFDNPNGNDLAITCRGGEVVGICAGHGNALSGQSRGFNSGDFTCEQSGATVGCRDTQSSTYTDFDGLWGFNDEDYVQYDDFAITCRSGALSAWCVERDVDPGPHPGEYGCEPVSYRWSPGGWGVCSAGGTQTRTVECVQESDGAVVADSNCDSGTRPATSQSCTPLPDSSFEGGGTVDETYADLTVDADDNQNVLVNRSTPFADGSTISVANITGSLKYKGFRPKFPTLQLDNRCTDSLVTAPLMPSRTEPMAQIAFLDGDEVQLGETFLSEIEGDYPIPSGTTKIISKTIRPSVSPASYWTGWNGGGCIFNMTVTTSATPIAGQYNNLRVEPTDETTVLINNPEVFPAGWTMSVTGDITGSLNYSGFIPKGGSTRNYSNNCSDGAVSGTYLVDGEFEKIAYVSFLNDSGATISSVAIQDIGQDYAIPVNTSRIISKTVRPTIGISTYSPRWKNWNGGGCLFNLLVEAP